MELMSKSQIMAGALALLVSAVTGWELHAQIFSPVTRCAGPKVVTQNSPKAPPSGGSAQDSDYSWQRWPQPTDF